MKKEDKICNYCGIKNISTANYCMECNSKISEAGLRREIEDLLINLESEDPDIQSRASNKLFTTLNPNFHLTDYTIVKNIVLNFGIDPIINTLKNSSSDIKLNMTWCLGHLNDKIAVQPLIESLGDEEVTGACIVNLVNLKEFSLNPLLNILNSPKDKKLVDAAAIALGQIKDDKAIEPLVKSFLSNSELSYNVSNALSEIKSPKAVKPLIEALNSEDKKLKRQIALILGNIGDKRAVEPLIMSLEDDDAYFRRQSIIALGKINDESVIEPLIKSLNDKTALVKGAAAEYLGEIGDKRSLEYLEPLLNDKNDNVKKTVKIAINKIKTAKKEWVVVPKWDGYYPSLDSATKEQKEFYEKWLIEFNRGNYIDIEGNLSYIFVFLYDIINKFIANKDIVFFLENFRKIEVGYNNYEKFKSYLSFWRICAYLYLDQRDKIWEEITSSDMNLDTALTSAAFLSEFDDSFFDGYEMIQIMNNEGLTKFAFENRENIGEIITILLEDFKKNKGKHILKYFIEEFNLENLTETDLNLLSTFFPKVGKFIECKKIYEENEKGKTENLYYGKTLKNYEFQGFPGVNINYPNDDPKFKRFLYQTYDDEKIYVPLIVIEAFKNEIKKIFRESENIYREEKDIPKVGEGWVSETELYYKIKESFPHEKIIHHGRPSWLGRQHLDIYFPRRNIAIEYQGEQHDSPIEYFGGKKSFQKRKTLDIQKKEKCNLNNCHLIYAHPDYNFKNIENEIKNHIIKINPKTINLI